MELTYEAIARRIDHALLTPTMTTSEMVAGCQLAKDYQVATVCIKPHAVALARNVLEGSTIGVGTVIGFPHGGQTTRCKVDELLEAVAAGANEADMVVNIGAVLGGAWDGVESEIGQILAAARQQQAVLKVIFETCYLNDEQKIQLCEICGRVGVDYVKTSTGFGSAGATEADIKLMRQHSPASVQVKASGGIRDLKSAVRFAELGSTRLGLSRTAEILEELLMRLGQPARVVSRGTTGRIEGNY